MTRRAYRDLTRFITLSLLLGLACSCVSTAVVQPPGGTFCPGPALPGR